MAESMNSGLTAWAKLSKPQRSFIWTSVSKILRYPRDACEKTQTNVLAWK